MRGSDVAWSWIRMKRLCSTRGRLLIGLALCAVLAIAVLVADGGGRHGQTIYASERGGGPWSRQHVYLDDRLSTWETIEVFVRDHCGLSPKAYAATCEMGEIRQVPPAEVPCLTISALARFLQIELGWSFQVLVQNSPTPISESAFFRGLSVPGDRGRLWKATVVCMHPRTHAVFLIATDVQDFGGGPRQCFDIPSYHIYMDENDHVFALSKHDLGGPWDAPIDPGDVHPP